jgi:hypothetical protein
MRETKGEVMKHRAVPALVLCLIAAAMLCIGASAAAADTGWPGVGTPQVAHVQPDGSWWAGGAGWGNDYAVYAPGTPVPAQDSVSMYMEIVDPDKSIMDKLPQILLNSVTVKGADGIVLKTTEEQSAQFWHPVKWWPAQAGWWRGWEAHVGQLPAGTYQVTWVQRLTTTVVASYPDENGNWVPFVQKPFKDTAKFSFTVQ